MDAGLGAVVLFVPGLVICGRVTLGGDCLGALVDGCLTGTRVAPVFLCRGGTGFVVLHDIGGGCSSVVPRGNVALYSLNGGISAVVPGMLGVLGDSGCSRVVTGVVDMRRA